MAGPLESSGFELIEDIGDRLDQCAKTGRDNKFNQGYFYYPSDLRRVWGESAGPQGFNDYRYLRRVVGRDASSPEELARLCSAVPLLSLAAWKRVRWAWFSEFHRLAFPPADLPKPELELPLEFDALKRLLGKYFVEEMYRLQFRFVPFRISIHDDAEPQTIGQYQVLPLEHTVKIGEGSFGQVHGGYVAPELIEAYPFDEHAWRPTRPYAVAVKVSTFGNTAGSSSPWATPHKADRESETRTLRSLKTTLGRTCANLPISLHHTIIALASEGEQTMAPLIVFPIAELGTLGQFLVEGTALAGVGGTFVKLPFVERFPELPDGPSPGRAVEPLGRGPIRDALLEQCLALTGGLQFLHRDIEYLDKGYKLGHLDLKPANILLFKRTSQHPVGVWKLADFGLSVTRDTRAPPPKFDPTKAPIDNDPSYSLSVDPRALNNSYSGPEVGGLMRLREHNSVGIGRKSDVWSLAAIFAEVMAFSMGRSLKVQHFRDSRARPSSLCARYKDDFFWERAEGSTDIELPVVDYTVFVLRKAVVDLLEEAGRSADPCYKEWASCIGKVLEPDPRRRPGAAKVYTLVKATRYLEGREETTRRPDLPTAPSQGPPEPQPGPGSASAPDKTSGFWE